MRYLIMEGQFPSMDHLPARVSREEAQGEVERMNKIVEKNNERYVREIAATTDDKLTRGYSFLIRRDDRNFSVKEIQ